MNAPSLRSPSRSCSARHRLPREPSWPAPRSQAIEWCGASSAARGASWSAPVAVFCSGRAGRPGLPAHSPRRARPPPSRPAQAVARAQIPPAPVETTFFAERPGHGWLPITPPVRCVSATAGRRLAVSGPLVATVTPNCGSPSKGTLRVRRDGRMVFRRAGVECCDVALAGTTLAWRSGGGVDVFGSSSPLSYRVTSPGCA